MRQIGGNARCYWIGTKLINHRDSPVTLHNDRCGRSVCDDELDLAAFQLRDKLWNLIKRPIRIEQIELQSIGFPITQSPEPIAERRYKIGRAFLVGAADKTDPSDTLRAP